jgi:hypothetical protein
MFMFGIMLTLKSVTCEAPTSRFLGLPAELRNMIYGYVLGGRTFRICGLYWGPLPVEATYSALLHVNPQIYAEALLLPYALNIFAFYDETDIRRFVRWHTEKQLAAVKIIRLYTERGGKMFSGYKLLTRETLSVLEGFSSTIEVVIIDCTFYGKGKARSDCLTLRDGIRYWKPEATISCEERDGTLRW